jgi:hypothetical protein
MNRRIGEAYSLIEEMALNQVQWSTEREPTKAHVSGRFETDQITKLQAMVEALQTENRQIKSEIRQNKRQDSANASSVDQFFPCATCGCTDHLTVNCIYQQMEEGSVEQANMLNNNFRPQNNPYSNTYNPGWRNHPNFSWRNDQGQQNPSQGRSNQGFGQRQYEPAAQPPKSNLERLIENFIENQTVTNQKNDDKFEEINQRLKNLENQIAQQVAATTRQQGQLPPKPEQNPREQAKAITLCSGKEYGGPSMPAEEGPEQPPKQTQEKEGEKTNDELEGKGSNSTKQVKEDVPKYIPPHRFVPFPERLANSKLKK